MDNYHIAAFPHVAEGDIAPPYDDDADLVPPYTAGVCVVLPWIDGSIHPYIAEVVLVQHYAVGVRVAPVVPSDAVADLAR